MSWCEVRQSNVQIYSIDDGKHKKSVRWNTFWSSFVLSLSLAWAKCNFYFQFHEIFQNLWSLFMLFCFFLSNWEKQVYFLMSKCSRFYISSKQSIFFPHQIAVAFEFCQKKNPGLLEIWNKASQMSIYNKQQII